MDVITVTMNASRDHGLFLLLFQPSNVMDRRACVVHSSGSTLESCIQLMLLLMLSPLRGETNLFCGEQEYSWESINGKIL